MLSEVTKWETNELDASPPFPSFSHSHQACLVHLQSILFSHLPIFGLAVSSFIPIPELPNGIWP